MRPATTVLLSTDPSLILEVERLHDSNDQLRLEVCGQIDKAYAQAMREEVRLLLIHLTPGRDPDTVTRLIRARSEAPRATTAVICDALEDDRLAGLGAGDHLFLRPDVGELSRLLEAMGRRGQAEPESAQACNAPGRRNGSANGAAKHAGHEIAALSEDDEQLLQIQQVSTQDTTVLLSGETGTGKTLLARRIHELSSHRGEPFLVVDCSSLSPSLIESEMFGHVRGAFTGADRDRPGKFEAVGRGTLVLDEINSLPQPLQGKLLRAVEERVFEPVGSNKTQPLRARLIAVSNCRLEDEVSAGRFRSDLYYRLNVVAFQLPPLRERRSVIPSLAITLLAEFSARYARPVEAIAPDALAALQGYDWPGNIRELRNVIERAVALCAGPTIQRRDLPEALRSQFRLAVPLQSPAAARPTPVSTGPGDELTELERITAALARHRNNRVRTAAALGISRVSLYKKLRKYGLMAPAAHVIEEAEPLDSGDRG